MFAAGIHECSGKHLMIPDIEPPVREPVGVCFSHILIQAFELIEQFNFLLNGINRIVQFLIRGF